MQYLVRDGTDLDGDPSFSTYLHKRGMLCKRVAVTDALGPKQDRIHQVLVGGVTALEGLAGVEKEWDIQPLGDTLPAECEQFREVIPDRIAAVLEADHVEA